MELIDYTKEELVDIINKQGVIIMELEEEIGLTANIGEYYKTKKRTKRRTDIDDEEIIRRYVGLGESVYKIAKDTGWPDMTIRNRLKDRGLYEGKNRKKKGE